MTQTSMPQLLPLPGPTRDLDQARRDLAETGLCIVADALPTRSLAEVRDAVYRAARADRARGMEVKFEGDYPEDNTNQRVWNLPSRDPVFLDLVEHPLALAFVRETIGWPALLSNISANITGPGGGEMMFHCDQIYMPQPWSGIQGINVIWCIDDFTDANGATRVVPGSQRLNWAPEEGDHDGPTVPLEAPAGSMVVMEGRVWHKTGNNHTADSTRAGVFAWYTLPIYLPQENWWLSLNPSVRQFGSEDLLTLFGYRVASFGKVNGVASLWTATPGVFVRMRAQPGRRRDLMAALQPLIASAGRETGTTTYLVHESTDDPDVVWFYARFADDAGLADHQANEAALADDLDDLGDLLADDPQIEYGLVVSAKGEPPPD